MHLAIFSFTAHQAPKGARSVAVIVHSCSIWIVLGLISRFALCPRIVPSHAARTKRIINMMNLFMIVLQSSKPPTSLKLPVQILFQPGPQPKGQARVKDCRLLFLATQQSSCVLVAPKENDLVSLLWAFKHRVLWIHFPGPELSVDLHLAFAVLPSGV